MHAYNPRRRFSRGRIYIITVLNFLIHKFRLCLHLFSFPVTSISNVLSSQIFVGEGIPGIELMTLSLPGRGLAAELNP